MKRIRILVALLNLFLVFTSNAQDFNKIDSIIIAEIHSNNIDGGQVPSQIGFTKIT